MQWRLTQQGGALLNLDASLGQLLLDRRLVVQLVARQGAENLQVNVHANEHMRQSGITNVLLTPTVHNHTELSRLQAADSTHLIACMALLSRGRYRAGQHALNHRTMRSESYIVVFSHVLLRAAMELMSKNLETTAILASRHTSSTLAPRFSGMLEPLTPASAAPSRYSLASCTRFTFSCVRSPGSMPSVLDAVMSCSVCRPRLCRRPGLG